MKTARQALSEEDKARCRRDDNNRKKTAKEHMTDEDKTLYNERGAENKRNQEDWKMKNNLL